MWTKNSPKPQPKDREMKAFIFDLDGVIVDTARFHFLAWKKLADELEIPFTEHDNERLKGVSRIRSLDIILEMGKVQMNDNDKAHFLKEKNEDYLSYIATMTPDDVLPDVPRILNFLNSHHIPMALGSASKNAKSILEKVHLLNAFNAIVDGNEVNKAKPDPEVFLIAAQKLSVPPQQCVVVEDAIAGIKAANAAQMYSIGIGHPAILSEARCVFKNFTEISDEFLNQLITNKKIPLL